MTVEFMPPYYVIIWYWCLSSMCNIFLAYDVQYFSGGARSNIVLHLYGVSGSGKYVLPLFFWCQIDMPLLLYSLLHSQLWLLTHMCFRQYINTKLIIVFQVFGQRNNYSNYCPIINDYTPYSFDISFMHLAAIKPPIIYTCVCFQMSTQKALLLC